MLSKRKKQLNEFIGRKRKESPLKINNSKRKKNKEVEENDIVHIIYKLYNNLLKITKTNAN